MPSGSEIAGCPVMFHGIRNCVICAITGSDVSTGASGDDHAELGGRIADRRR